TKVTKNGSTIGQYEYDGDGGRTKKTATVSGQTTTTTFVGALFETSGSRSTKFIFLGGQRVAAVTNSPSLGSSTLYYHSDHLGGANVLTDATGFKKELIEYEPFGLESRHEKYGSSEEVAWYYFTGKKTDDESGLIYFGARYYDPKLGRFITADSVVQDPYDPQSLNRYSYTSNNPINRIDLDGHKWSWGKFWKSVGIAIVGITLTVMSAGTLTPLIGAYWAGVAGGALAGATIGGTFAAATGGNIGMGLLTGAVGGGLFAGLAPGLGAFSDGIFRGISLGGAAGPLSSGASMASNFTAGFLGGAASGAAVAGINGEDIGQAALMGGAIAGGFALGRDAALLMRAETARSSSLDPLGRNTSGKSVGFNGDGKKYAGARNNPNNPNAWPAPLGGHQGGQGKVFGFNYPHGSIVDRVFEAYAGPHDWLNGWTYDSMGNLRNLNIAEGFINTFTNPLNVVIATPIVASSVMPRGAYAAPSIIYGEIQGDD
ncbi:MAG TPA: hypothetical protein DCY86_01860, partial [Bdellovibrionales bacterium]|nr:hypothetical protein [Bdellovibrionales bacterium]